MRISDWSSDVCSSDLPDWESWLAHDFGTSSPSATYVLARSPGATGPDGLFYPHGSIVVLDELATSRPNRPTEGLGWTVPRLAEAITQMCGRWDIPPSGAADDAIFARSRGIEAATIADEFSQQDRKSTRLNSHPYCPSRLPTSAL